MQFFLSLLCFFPLCHAFAPHTSGNRHASIGSNGADNKFKRRYSDSSRPYANLADPPTSTKPSFEARMRDLVLSKPNKKDKETSSSLSPAPEYPHVQRVTGLQDYKRAVSDTDKLTVVRFYADYCRACRAMTPAFYRLARTRDPETTQWAEVPVTPESAAIHKGLGVSSTPYGHIYHPQAGLVEELRLRKEYLGDFARILESYESGECLLPEEPNPETGVYESMYKRHS